MWDDEDELGEGKADLRAFARKVAASDGLEYSVDEAEYKDLIYLVENTCIKCNKFLGKDDIKIVPPRYIQERDPQVRNGIVDRRVMCSSCYSSLRSLTRVRTPTIVARRKLALLKFMGSVLSRRLR